jgi:hypothetical protein
MKCILAILFGKIKKTGCSIRSTANTSKIHQTMNLDNVKIGTLIKAFDSIFQYLGNGNLKVISTKDKCIPLKSLIDIPYLEYIAHSTFKGEITTAFESGIEDKQLHISEPIDATGWVIDDTGYKFEPLSFTGKYAEDGWHQLYEWEFCKPCLTPNK